MTTRRDIEVSPSMAPSGARGRKVIAAIGIDRGYLIPADASSSSDDVSTWIDLEGWLRAVALLPAKHILVILDACRSGITLDGIIQRHRGDESWQHETSAALQARRSRRIITSALGDQVALDSGPKHGHSLFTGCLIEGLTYDLRRRGDRATTGSGLGMYLQRRVDTHTRSHQTPDFGTFFHDDRGEIAIPLVGDTSHDRVPERAPTGHLDDVGLDVTAERPGLAVERAASDEPALPSQEARPEHPTVASSPASPSNPGFASVPPAESAVRTPAGDAAAVRGLGHASRFAPLDDSESALVVEQLERLVTGKLERMTLEAALASLAACATAAILFDPRREAISLAVALIAGLVVLAAVARRLVAPIAMGHVVHAVRDAPRDVVSLRHTARTAPRLQRITVTAGLVFVLSLVASAALDAAGPIAIGTLVALALLVSRMIAPISMRFIAAVRGASARTAQRRTARSWIEVATYSHRIALQAADDADALFSLLMRRCPTAKVEWRADSEETRDQSYPRL